MQDHLMALAPAALPHQLPPRQQALVVPQQLRQLRVQQVLRPVVVVEWLFRRNMARLPRPC
jgi:hypothetical protein